MAAASTARAAVASSGLRNSHHVVHNTRNATRIAKQAAERRNLKAGKQANKFIRARNGQSCLSFKNPMLKHLHMIS